MSQRYNDNVKRPKSKENQLGILKIYAFSRKIRLRTLGPGEHCCGYVSIYENTTKKLLQLYLVVQGRVQLEHSTHIVKVSVEATC